MSDSAYVVEWALRHGQWLAPSWAGHLRNLYWHVRAARRGADRRSAYRAAQVEKFRLLADGVDPELLRLACRYFKGPDDKARAVRVARYQYLLGRAADVEEFTGRQVWASSFDD